MNKLQNKPTSSTASTSPTSRIVHFVTGSTLVTVALLLAVTFCLTCTAAVAQDRTWQVDPQYSFAHLSLRSGAHSQPIDVAPVSGKVVVDSGDSDPSVDINIKAGSRLGSAYSQISFKSNRTEITREGNLAVVGELSVTRVETSATWDPSEAYSGPEYGQPVVHTDTREVTLVFPIANLPAAENGAIRVSASTTIGREDFPQLLAGLESDNTTAAAVDENCTVPSAGEDYSGQVCTGTPVATSNKNVATIALDLKLTQAPPTTSSSCAGDALAGH
jgi:polyisoprenoid-binding protein YceI